MVGLLRYDEKGGIGHVLIWGIIMSWDWTDWGK